MFTLKPSDTVSLSGWIFADLLLALAVLFLVANTVGVKPQIIPPTLIVTPTSLDPSNPACTGGTDHPSCTISVTESSSGSVNDVTWTGSSDMSDKVSFSPASTHLTPGNPVSVTISSIPCQNGSFTITGSGDARPVPITWKCSPPPVKPQRLESTFTSFLVQNVNFNGLLKDDQQAISYVRSQVAQRIPAGRDVGLFVIYGGAPTDNDISQAFSISDKVYSILGSLPSFHRASHYVHLYTLGNTPDTVGIDFYLFAQ
jgi:hypothetical protein